MRSAAGMGMARSGLALANAVPTLYTRIGDAFGWLCAVLSVLFIAWTILTRTRAGQGG